MSEQHKNLIHQSFPLGMKLNLSVTLVDQQAADWLMSQLHSKQPELYTPENFLKGMQLTAVGFYDVLNLSRPRIELLANVHRQFQDGRLPIEQYNPWVNDILDTLIRQDFHKTVDATVAVPATDTPSRLVKLVYQSGTGEQSINLNVWETEHLPLGRALDIISTLNPHCHVMAAESEAVTSLYTQNYFLACDVESAIRKLFDRVEGAQ